MIYLHRESILEMLGRDLIDGEVVHHIDENKSNNDPSNLMVFKSQADHVSYHRLKANEREVLQLSDGAYICRQKPSAVCSVCGIAFIPKRKNGTRAQKYCSHSCSAKSKKLFGKSDSSREKVELHKTIWNKPMHQIAKEMGVSDTAIKKRCIKFGIPRPGRGFWAKIEAGKLESQSCPLP